MRDDDVMRTTLDIDEDILKAAKAFAEAHGTTAGKVLSDWGRKALEPPASLRDDEIRNGVPVIRGRRGAPKTTSADVKALEEEMDLEDAQRFKGPLVRDAGELSDEEFRWKASRDEPDGPVGR
jgi:hypothetical protein